MRFFLKQNIEDNGIYVGKIFGDIFLFNGIYSTRVIHTYEEWKNIILNEYSEYIIFSDTCEQWTGNDFVNMIENFNGTIYVSFRYNKPFVPTY
jgi:hypothetical protein